ncbi:MAG: OprO/OprP family phosphate-selective porin [Gammaproteobacteria bacterium]
MGTRIKRLTLVVSFLASFVLIQHSVNATSITGTAARNEKKLETVEGKQKSIKNIKQESANTVSIEPENKYKLSTKGGVKITSEDGSFSAEVGGQILTDFAWYDEDKSDLGDGTKYRTSRLFLQGTLFKDWHYKGEYDFADENVKAKDVWISYTGFSPLYIKAGHYKPPFSLEQLTSIRFITFLERGFLDNFVPGRLMGVSAGTTGENWSATLGAFGSSAGGDATQEGDENWSAIGRVTYAPIHESTRSLHFGLSGRYMSAQEEPVRYRAKPSSNVTDVRFVDTNPITDVDTTVSLNAELATVYGPLSLQSQYVQVSVYRDGQNSDPDFSSWYIYGSYFLTGESRNYSVKTGAFDRITPKNNFNINNGGIGAWELVTRFDTIDLNDQDIFGGEEENITLGLNWYINPYVRMMMNYVWVNGDEFATGNIANLHSSETSAGSDDPNIFQIRVQADF